MELAAGVGAVLCLGLGVQLLEVTGSWDRQVRGESDFEFSRYGVITWLPGGDYSILFILNIGQDTKAKQVPSLQLLIDLFSYLLILSLRVYLPSVLFFSPCY